MRETERAKERKREAHDVPAAGEAGAACELRMRMLATRGGVRYSGREAAAAQGGGGAHRGTLFAAWMSALLSSSSRATST